MGDTPWQGDACSLVDAFRSGERSPAEELAATYDAIEASSLNAFCFLDREHAESAARDADVSKPFGGVPMCHGAGGMAGHVRFGAQTGGAIVILGVILCLVALFFSDSVSTLLRIFPVPMLGVVLFLTGAQLALGSCDFSKHKNERFATLVTAGCAIWNVGLGFALGWLLLWAMGALGLTRRRRSSVAPASPARGPD